MNIEGTREGDTFSVRDFIDKLIISNNAQEERLSALEEDSMDTASTIRTISELVTGRMEALEEHYHNRIGGVPVFHNSPELPDSSIDTPTAEEVRKLPKEQRDKILEKAAEDYKADTEALESTHDWRTCEVTDCQECQSLVDSGIIMACDECDKPGHIDADGWVIKDERVLCQHCAELDAPKAPELHETMHDFGEGDREAWYVECENCAAFTGYYETPDEAKEAHNTRPTEDELREKAERFQRMYGNKLRECGKLMADNEDLTEQCARLNKSCDAYEIENERLGSLVDDNFEVAQKNAGYIVQLETENERLKVDMPEQNRQIEEQWDTIESLNADLAEKDKQLSRYLEMERRARARQEEICNETGFPNEGLEEILNALKD